MKLTLKNAACHSSKEPLDKNDVGTECTVQHQTNIYFGKIYFKYFVDYKNYNINSTSLVN